jgi:hypothetical protein
MQNALVAAQALFFYSWEMPFKSKNTGGGFWQLAGQRCHRKA